jgi:hypothetical protein
MLLSMSPLVTPWQGAAQPGPLLPLAPAGSNASIAAILTDAVAGAAARDPIYMQ